MNTYMIKKKPNCQNCSKFFTTIRLPLVTAKGCSCNCNIFLLEPSSPKPCTCKVHATIILSASVDSRSWFTNLCITKHLWSKLKSFETNTGLKNSPIWPNIRDSLQNWKPNNNSAIYDWRNWFENKVTCYSVKGLLLCTVILLNSLNLSFSGTKLSNWVHQGKKQPNILEYGYERAYSLPWSLIHKLQLIEWENVENWILVVSAGFYQETQYCYRILTDLSLNVSLNKQQLPSKLSWKIVCDLITNTWCGVVIATKKQIQNASTSEKKCIERMAFSAFYQRHVSLKLQLECD